MTSYKSPEYYRIVVNTTSDISDDKDGLTTLREAINEANEFFSGEGVRNQSAWRKEAYSKGKQVKDDKERPPIDTNVYIDFEADDNAKSWILYPETVAYPALKYGNIFINYNNTKNIIISGENLPQENNSSLLTFGDAIWSFAGQSEPSWRYPFYPDHNRTIDARWDIPWVQHYINPSFNLKNINFISNTAKGEDGSKGSGGGLGAGGGISIVRGTVNLENIVFQDLIASGGVGGEKYLSSGGSKTGGSYQDGEGSVGNGSSQNGSKGKSGGSGGRRGSFIGEFATKNTNLTSLGGNGGKSGDAHKAYDKRMEGVRRELMTGHSGSKGASGLFGAGGGAGGGGGGSSSITYLQFLSWYTQWAQGGFGGGGGDGGFGAGGGGGGGAGRTSYSKTGDSGPGGKGGEFGTDGQKMLNYPRYSSGAGGHGAGLGGAIALLHPEAKANLVNVDFINNSGIASGNAGKFNHLFSRYADPAESSFGGVQVTANSVKIYENSDDLQGRDIPTGETLINDDFHTFVKKNDGLTKPAFLYNATSFVREPTLVRTRNTHINLNIGKPEIVNIQFERPKSTITPINIDSSGLESELNDLYQRVIPVESEETIKSRMINKQLQAGVELGLSLIGDIGFSTADDLFKASINTYTNDDRIQGIATGAGLSIAKFAWSSYQIQNEYADEIRQNNENIKELEKRTVKNRTLVTADPIDITQERTLIEIDNFSIGEDVLVFDDFGNQGPKIQRGNLSADTGTDNDNRSLIKSFEIHLPNRQKNNNASTRVATISLDQTSQSALSKTNDAIGYIEDLISYNVDEKYWVLGTTIYAEENLASQRQGGPAAEIVVLKPSSKDSKDIMSVVTRYRDDFVYGSNNNDKINTSEGNDQIFPGLGIDTVNGGESFDKADYQNVRMPISVVGGKYKDNSGNSNSEMSVSFVEENESTLNSNLSNIEVITAWGASNFDFNSLPKPDDFSNIKIDQSSFSGYDGVETQTNTGYYGIRSGSGSTIEGSSFSDTIIISMMQDENEDNYLDKEDFKLNVDTQAYSATGYQTSDKAVEYEVLSNPSLIAGGGGKNKLKFAYNGTSPDLNLLSINDAPDGLEGYQAVVQDNIVIAYVKDFDNIESVGNKDEESSSIMKLDNVLINLKLIKHGDFRASHSINNLEESNVHVPEDTSVNLGSQNHDFIKLNSLHSTIRTDIGNDTVFGTSAADFISGEQGNDSLHGASGDDSLRGGSGNDILLGDKGDDFLHGGKGDDLIIGGNSTNTIIGGAGYDTIHLSKNGYQVIKDFDVYKDSIQVSTSIDPNALTIDSQNIIYHDGTAIAEIVPIGV